MKGVLRSRSKFTVGHNTDFFNGACHFIQNIEHLMQYLKEKKNGYICIYTSIQIHCIYLLYIFLYIYVHCQMHSKRIPIPIRIRFQIRIQNRVCSFFCSTIHRPITGFSQVSGATCKSTHALYYTHVLDILYKK